MKKSLFLSTAALFLAAGIVAAGAQAPRGPSAPQMRGDGPSPVPVPFSIERADPGMDKIIAPDAKLKELARGFGLIEAGLWVADGNSGFWIFGGLLDNVLYKLTPQGQVSVFMEKAGYTGNDPDHSGTQTRAGRHHVLLIGPSCTGMDHEGRIIWCADNDREVMRLEKDGTHTVMSGGMNGQKFSGPNDIAIAADDTLYITDNDFGLRDAGKNPDKQLANGIYMVKDGKTTLALSDTDLGGTPNGIAISPDGKWMYLSARGGMKRYAVNADGTLGAGAMFFTGAGVGDGEKTDKAGNIFSAGGAGIGIIAVHAPDGKLLGRLHMPIEAGEPKRQICALNEAFGGTDGKMLYISGCDSAFVIPLRTSGIVPAYEVKK